MLLFSVDNSLKTITAEEPRKVGEYLSFQLREKLNPLQSASVNSLASLLDPRYKALSFFSPNKLKEATKRLTTKLSSMVRNQNNNNGAVVNEVFESLEQNGKLRSSVTSQLYILSI